MKPFYSDDWLTLYGGDCREVLASLPSDLVDCVVTSPPYWGLRDYGTATWEGGDAECDHDPDKRGSRFATPVSAKQRSNTGSGSISHRDCKCGATRIDSQLGLERTPEEYVANMVAVFREVRRVLKPSGTCWLNLGDSYASDTKGNGGPPSKTLGIDSRGVQRTSEANRERNQKRNRYSAKIDHGLKQKDLVGIPWRVAFALQADGWYLRSDIIWSKPNPMPESVTDRPTKAHEYLFLLTKSARYYFDADAVREALAGPLHAPGNKPEKGVVQRNDFGTERMEALWGNPAGRNIRSVWTIASRPYPGAHFAVFPPELPERCIKAGSSEKGVCPECGAPWERVIASIDDERKPYRTQGDWANGSGRNDGKGLRKVLREDGRGGDLATKQRETTGWRPTCDHKGYSCECSCHAEMRPHICNPSHMETTAAPAVILDPFGGSGTVGMVTNRLSRRAILIDLNPEYLKQQMKRNAQTPLGLGI